MKIGIIGHGFVGKATKLLKQRRDEVVVYDIVPEKCIPFGIVLNDIRSCDIVFVCVPTPMYDNGECCLDYVNSVVNDLKDIKEKIVLRSTVPVGTCEDLGVSFMPEFLTEKNWKQDVLDQDYYIIGSNSEELKQKLKQFLRRKEIHNVSTQEAELCKLTRNAFLSTKVSFFNEIHEFCQEKNVDYRVVRHIVTLDDRIGASHTLVPGHDGEYGFGGICLPKDTESLLRQFEKNNTKSYILSAVLSRNKTVDRPTQDWKEFKGRSCI